MNLRAVRLGPGALWRLQCCRGRAGAGPQSRQAVGWGEISRSKTDRGADMGSGWRKREETGVLSTVGSGYLDRVLFTLVSALTAGALTAGAPWGGVGWGGSETVLRRLMLPSFVKSSYH